MENYPMLFPCPSSSYPSVENSRGQIRSNNAIFRGLRSNTTSNENDDEKKKKKKVEGGGSRSDTTTPTATSLLLSTHDQIRMSGSSTNMMMMSDEVGGGGGGCSSGTNNKKKGDRKVKKPKYAFQTRSQVDILDDGYRWRKYGQKAVKNNKFPRSYYRCTHQGCNVKKQVQRLTKDEGVVVTTYEGVHTHPIEKTTDNFEHILSQMQIYTPF